MKDLENQGKREAVLVVSALIRENAARPGGSARILDVGCGEGQLLAALVDGHPSTPGITASAGLDYQMAALQKARRQYPYLKFIEADYRDPGLLEQAGTFNIVMLVNTLHEVFSACYQAERGEVDRADGKRQVQAALVNVARLIEPGGSVVLFDGVEYPGDLDEQITLRFLNNLALEEFRTFAHEYQALRITYREYDRGKRVDLSRRDFTRYITKTIFLGRPLWSRECRESYQYYNEVEFRSALAAAGLEIRELRYLTVDEEKWQSRVEIETPGVDFPAEHILIVAKRPAAGE